MVEEKRERRSGSPAFCFPNWKIVREIGEGSFGHVYEIAREEYGITYRAAMKKISLPRNPQEVQALRDTGMSQEEIRTYYTKFVQQMVGEIQLMSRLKGQTHIVSYEDHAVVPHEDGIGADICIRMELLTPLLTYTRHHVLTCREVVTLGEDVCRALELCRRHAIIHRDIKPENIFVSENGDFKLGDFGVARQTERTVCDLSVRGTYTYMAPEVFRGEEYGPTVDGYSLGLVLYRFLNDGRMPFMPAYPAAVEYGDAERANHRRFSGDPLPAPAHAGRHLTKVILKACAFQPADRYENAEAMRLALEAVPKRELDVFSNGTMPYTEYSQLSGMNPQDTRPAQPEREATPAPSQVQGDSTVWAPEKPVEQGVPGRTERQEAKPFVRKKWPLFVAAGAAGLLLILLGIWIYALTRPIPVTEVRFSQEEWRVERGDAMTLSVQVLPENATDPTLSFISSNEAVLLVDESGKVTALASGSAEITARSGDCSAVCTVQVVVSAQSLTLSDTELRLPPGEEYRLTAAVSPVDTTDSLSYQSEDPSVVQVDSEGNLTALKEGETVITAVCGSRRQTCRVVVAVPVESVTLNKEALYLGIGQSQKLKVEVLPENATDPSVSFVSSNPSVVSVDEQGQVKALAGGTAEITVHAGEKTAACQVYVSGSVTEERADGSVLVSEYSRWGVLEKTTEITADGSEILTQYDEKTGEMISRTTRRADGTTLLELFGEKEETFSYNKKGELTSHTVDGEEVPVEENHYWWEDLLHNILG